MTRVNVLDEQDEAEMLERAIAMSLMEVEGQQLGEEELHCFTDHQLGEDLSPQCLGNYITTLSFIN